MSATRADERLWGTVKVVALADGGRWNTRKAYLAVRLYKRRGSGYIGPKPPPRRGSAARCTARVSHI